MAQVTVTAPATTTTVGSATSTAAPFGSAVTTVANSTIATTTAAISSSTAPAAAQTILAQATGGLVSNKEFLEQGKTLYLQKDYNNAMSALNRAIELNLTDGEAYYYRGLVYQSLGDKKASKSDFDKAASFGCILALRGSRESNAAFQI